MRVGVSGLEQLPSVGTGLGRIDADKSAGHAEVNPLAGDRLTCGTHDTLGVGL